MKKISQFLLFAILLTASPAVFAKDAKPRAEKELSAAQEARLMEISRRVEEIKAMDLQSLNRADRKELKQELLQLKKEAKVMKGGVYLSVGAIIIIILVLILIL